MKEIAKGFELCKFGLYLAVKGFNLEGIFVAHLKSVRYSNLSGIFTPREIEENPGSPKTIVSPNMLSKKLKETKSRMI